MTARRDGKLAGNERLTEAQVRPPSFRRDGTSVLSTASELPGSGGDDLAWVPWRIRLEPAS